MTIRVLHFDVFTLTPGKGNPAGIVLSAENLDESAMQSIAKAMGFNDTAFISSSPAADFRIRYFSPSKEIDLCGHATIAASIALHTLGPLAGKAVPCKFSLDTNAGILPISIDTAVGGEAMVSMTQAPSAFKEYSGDRTLLLHSLGISATDLHSALPLMYGSTGRWTLIVPVQGLDAMRRMRPRPAEFAAALIDMPEASIHPFCFETVGANVDMHARHFSSPSSGTVEDPVTGTASGVLGAYYREFVDRGEDGSRPLVIEQGLEIGREGCVWVWTVRTSGYFSGSMKSWSRVSPGCTGRSLFAAISLYLPHQPTSGPMLITSAWFTAALMHICRCHFTAEAGLTRTPRPHANSNARLHPLRSREHFSLPCAELGPF